VWTLRTDPIAPFAVEAGGEFIDGDHKQIRSLARQLELSLVRVLREGFGLVLQRGQRVRVHRELRRGEMRLEFFTCRRDSRAVAR
jgi:hypothetical protein